jgi:hypothetical protein
MYINYSNRWREPLGTDQYNTSDMGGGAPYAEDTTFPKDAR